MSLIQVLTADFGPDQVLMTMKYLLYTDEDETYSQHLNKIVQYKTQTSSYISK